MSKRLLVAGCLTIASVALVSGQSARAPSPLRQSPKPVATPAALDVAQQRAVIDQYCVVCHNQKLKTANLLLDQLDLTHFADRPDLGEKIVRKLRAGMMPPTGMPRPDPAAREALITWMEKDLDSHATTYLPPPGIHRLNRTEYTNVIRDLLGLEVDATRFLPSDDSTHGFDNIAGALTMSPALMEAYLSAAGKISRLAIGSATAPIEMVYTVADDVTQDYHIEGLPFGTRGGVLIRHEFPADAEYEFRVVPVTRGTMDNFVAFGEVKGEKLEVRVDGQLVKLFDWDKEVGVGYVTRSGAVTGRIPVKAGLHTIGVTFRATNYAPGNDLENHFLRSTIMTYGLPGYTFYPHVGTVKVDGPFDANGATDTPSRTKIFVCQPTSA